MKETKQLEFKQNITNTFLKTVCAFANYEGGQIKFGVSDNGEVIGLENPTKACLDIENKINDTIHPQPQYELCVDESNSVVVLSVEAGRNKPYTYKSKAYKRNDTSTIEVDAIELTRLILKGKNLNYEDLPATKQDLSFQILETKAKQEIGINLINKDILKTLNLYSDQEGYNHAAELLADQNEWSGIDIAKFGDNISVIQKRITYEHESVLSLLDHAVAIYQDYYQYEEIKGIHRTRVEIIPEEAFRETIANALIHRTWDINTHIRVRMFDDKIEVISPGGLPSEIGEEEYLKGTVSILRNPILGNVFYRLHVVEILGTGILRIKEAYNNSTRKPKFEIFEHSIKVTLPVTNSLDLSEDEQIVYDVLSKTIPKSTSEITTLVPFGKSKTTTILKSLVTKDYITQQGNGRGTKYKL